MKKTDLRRSIDGIKQDKELKEQILKAVQEKDKVTVIKRPLFVPMLAICLLCLNIGMIAKLVIFNKSQVNMSELKARTQLSSIADYDESLLDTAEKVREEQEKLESENQKQQEKLEQQMQDQERISEKQKRLEDIKEDLKDPVRIARELDFEDEKERLEEKLENGKLIWFNERTVPKDYDPQKEIPCYLLSGNIGYSGYYDGAVGDWDYVCVRYVEYQSSIENGNGNTDVVYFNHEYLVVYNGDTSDPDNIVSITESNVAPQECSREYLSETAAMKEWYDFDKYSFEKAYNQWSDDTIDFENLASYGYNVISFVLYPKTAGGSLERLQTVRLNWYKESNDENIDLYNESVAFLLDENQNDVTEKYRTVPEDYWRETSYTGYDINVAEKTVVPNVLGMPRKEAEKVLREAGFSNFNTRFDAADNPYTKPGQIKSCYPQAGTTVYKGSDIELSICGQMVPYAIGYSAEDAVKMLENCGYTAKLEYHEGVDPNDYDLFVERCSPDTGKTVKAGSEVTIKLTTPDAATHSAMLGKAISLRRVKVYSAAETAELIAGKEQPEQTQIRLADYHYYPKGGIAVGRQYDDVFLIESLTVNDTKEGGDGEVVPYLFVRMPLDYSVEGLATFIANTEFYKNRNAVFSTTDYEDYDLLLYYKNKSGKEMYAYIKLQDYPDTPQTGTKEVTEICVSEHKLT